MKFEFYLNELWTLLGENLSSPIPLRRSVNSSEISTNSRELLNSKFSKRLKDESAAMSASFHMYFDVPTKIN